MSIAEFVDWSWYQRQLRIYPSRQAVRASIGPRRRFRTGIYGKEVNKAQECARRRRQIARGMLKLEER